MLARPVWRLLKTGMKVNGRSLVSVGPARLDVNKFLTEVNKKPVGAIKTIIWPSTQLDIEISTKLVGAAFGIEGMKIFPSVFDPDHIWKPSDALIDAVKFVIMHEACRGDGNVDSRFVLIDLLPSLISVIFFFFCVDTVAFNNLT